MRLFKTLFHSIRGRLIVSVFIIHAILMGLVIYDLIERQQSFMKEQLSAEGMDLAALIASNAAIPMLNNDLVAMNEILDVVHALPDVYMVFLSDHTDRIRASYPPQYFNQTLNDTQSLTITQGAKSHPSGAFQMMHDGVMDTVHPVTVENRIIGYVRIMTNSLTLEQKLDVLTEEGLLYILIAIIAGVFFAWLAVRQMTYRISLISAAALKVAKKDFNVTLPRFSGDDEVSEMGRGFSVMIDSIQSQIGELRETLQKLETSEQTLQLAFEGSNDGVWDWNLTNNTIYFSPRWKAILGYNDDEIANEMHTWYGRVHTDDLQRLIHTLQTNIDGNTAQIDTIHRVKHKEGQWLWIRVRGKTHFDKSGHPVRTIGTATDITGQKQLEEKASYQHSLLLSVLDSTPDLVFYKDYHTQDGIYIGCNSAFCEFAGQPADKIIGRNDIELFGEEAGAFFRRKDREMLQKGASKTNEEWVTYPDGKRVLLYTYKTPFYDHNHILLGVLGISHDITLQHEHQQVIETHKKALEDAQAIAHLGNWRLEIATGLMEWSDEVYRIFGTQPQSFTVTYERFFASIPPEEQPKVQAAMNTAIEQKTPCEIEHKIYLEDGSQRYVRELAHAEYDANGDAASLFGVILDITALKMHEEAEKLRNLQGQRYQKALFDWSKIDYKNAETAISRAIEIAAKTLELERVSVWLFHDDVSMLTCADLYILSERRHSGGMQLFQTGIPHYFDNLKQGLLIIVDDALEDPRTQELRESYLKPYDIRSIMDVPVVQDGKVIGVVCFEQIATLKKWALEMQEFAVAIAGTVALSLEIDKRKRMEEQLAHKAHYDDLTELPNRSLFLDRLRQALKQASRLNNQTAVLFIDLDHFKEINDSLGHGVGDQVLIHVAQRLHDNLREVDTIARLGGDEFTLIIENVHEAQQISDLAAKLIRVLQEPIFIDEHELYVTSSVGISIYPHDGDTPESMLRNADAAMYKAKAEGRNSYQYYTEDMTERAFERVAMEASMRRALEKEEFIIYYQPQFNGQAHKPTGMEALVRWQHPDMGLVPPAKFIPLAEETGLIVPIDRFVMKKTMQQMVLWYQMGLNPGIAALNLAMKQLQQEDFLSTVKAMLKDTGCRPEWLEFEITEGQIMKKPDEAILILKKINELGIQIAIDDFGTGYSSLSYLKRLPIDKLKIDQSFVSNLPDDEEDVAIAKAVIALSKSLNLSVIAEGVETKEQKDFLVAQGCLSIQGYYYGKPMPAEEMEAMLTAFER